jgi:tetraacyldisaccharide 4'-kinase
VSNTVSDWLERRWYGGIPAGPGLRMLAGLYRLGKAVRESRISPATLPAPVLVIGNFTAGGTGKTPLTIAVARWLAAEGRAPAILSRGHGRTSREPVQVDADTLVAEGGDEPTLLFEQAGVPVFVDADRVAAGRAALAAGARVLLCDDGLQHRALARDLEIEVVDGVRGYGNGLLLPAGPLREAPRACDLRVVNGSAAGSAPLPGAVGAVARAGDWTMQLQAGALRPLDGAVPSRRLEDFAGRTVHAVAGIGNPMRFFDMLRAHGIEVVPHAFSDHHAYSPVEFEPVGRPLLMTAKDAVKCRAFGLEDAWVVDVEAVLDPSFFDALARALDAIDAAGR